MNGNLSAPATRCSRSKSLGSDDVFYTRSQENVLSYENKVFNFIQTSERQETGEYSSPSLLRSNSFTGRQMSYTVSTPQTAKSYFISRRRMSISLPELRNLRIFPDYSDRNVINGSLSGFGDVDDSDSYIAHDIPLRKVWSTKADFILTSLGYTLGLNNLWRLPYFCYANDGGSFFVVYLIMMVIFGVPLLCMEYSIGQLTQSGHSIFGTLCPILKGIVISSAFATCLMLLVYGTINSWTMFYLLKSFVIPPWSKCGNIWNSDQCINTSDTFSRSVHSQHLTNNSYVFSNILSKHPLLRNGSSLNFTQHQSISSYYSSQEFFDHKLLSLSPDSSGLGIIRWELAIFLAAIWIVVFVTLKKNIHLSSHPTYALAILPFTMVVILFIRTLMLSDMKNGLIYLLKPSAEGIKKPEVWLYAASLCVHSFGSVLGTSVASAKCNKEKNNFLRDAFIVCLMNMFVAFAVGSIVFGTLGYLSKKRSVSISKVVVDEPGFAFVVYSEHLLTMPFTSVWSAVFFLFMFCSGVHYQIVSLATLLTCFEELFAQKIKEKFFSQQFFVMVVCVILFMFNLVFLTQNGMSIVITFEKFITIWLTIIIAFFEVILIGWFYGGRKLSQIIKLKTSKALGCYLPFCWTVCTPIILTAIIVVNAAFNDQLSYRGLKSFFIVRIVGLVLLLSALLILPIVAIMEVIRTPKTTLVTRILNACKPRNECNELKTAVIYANDALIWPQEQSSNQPKVEFPKDNTMTPVTFSLIAGLDKETTI